MWSSLRIADKSLGHGQPGQFASQSSTSGLAFCGVLLAAIDDASATSIGADADALTALVADSSVVTGIETDAGAGGGTGIGTISGVAGLSQPVSQTHVMTTNAHRIA
jgi:hypothetical protein